MLPGSRTRDVICKAAPMPYPKGNPRHRVPAVSPRDTRPTARFIEDNIVLCVHRLRRCHADCFPPSPAALRLPDLWQSSRQLAGILPASRPRRRLKRWRGKTPARGKRGGRQIFEPPDAQEARRRVASPRPPSIHLPGEAGRATRQQKRKRAIDAYVVRVREGTGKKAIFKHSRNGRTCVQKCVR
jgi:hypothetical protein